MDEKPLNDPPSDSSSTDSGDRLDRWFIAASELPDAERQAFLEKLDADDREHVQRLLAADASLQKPGKHFLGDATMDPEAGLASGGPATAGISRGGSANVEFSNGESSNEGSSNEGSSNEGSSNVDSSKGGAAATARPGDPPGGSDPMATIDSTPPGTDSFTPHAGRSDAEPVRYFGEYELLGEIARGGMGVVYRARQTNLNRIVALKMILAGQLAGENEIARFRREAEAAAKLDHPGIVPIFEIGTHDDQQYFSMGFVEGPSLQDRLADGPLPPRDAATLGRQIADAIHYAHTQGVVHRDLKPANVLIDGDGMPKVTDFGLAKNQDADHELTRSGTIMGTPGYMPPEQAGGGREVVDARSDVYSLGAILYCLVTGRPPFQSASVIDTIRDVINRPPVPPRDLVSSVPKDLTTIVLKCLEKVPSKRYGSAAELSEELGRFLRGEPIQARPVRWPERTWRLARRHPLPASLIATLLLLMAALAIGGPLIAVRQAELKSAAERSRDAAETLSDTNRQQLVANHLARAADVGSSDPSLALSHFVEAYQTDRLDDASEREHRQRIASAWVQTPRFADLWGHDAAIGSVEISPDHRWVLSTGYDNRLVMRPLDSPPDASSAKGLESQNAIAEQIAFEHDMPVWHAATAPNGNRVATASGSGLSGRVQVFDVATGRLIAASPPRSPQPFRVFWMPEDRIAAIGVSLAGGGHVTTYDAADLRVIDAFEFPVFGNGPTSIETRVQSRSGKMVQLRDETMSSNKVQVKNLLRPDDPPVVLDHPDEVQFGWFHSNDPFLLTATEKQVFAWHVDTGKLHWKTNATDMPDEVSLNMFARGAFSLDASGATIGLNSEKVLRIRDRGQSIDVQELDTENTSMRLVSPDARLVALSANRGEVRVWNVVTGLWETAPMHHPGGVRDMRWSADARRLVTGSIDGTVRVWDLAFRDSMPTTSFSIGQGAVWHVESDDGGKTITAAGHSYFRRFDSETGETNQIRFSDRWNFSDFDRIDDWLPLANLGGEIAVVDRKTGAFRFDPVATGRPNVQRIKIDPTARWLAVRTADAGLNTPFGHTASIYDAQTGQTQHEGLQVIDPNRVEAGDLGSVLTLGFDDSGRRLGLAGMVLSRDGRGRPAACVIDVASGERRMLAMPDQTNLKAFGRIEFLPGGNHLVTTGKDPLSEQGGELRIWDAKTLEPVGASRSVAGGIESLAISQDGRRVAIAHGTEATVIEVPSGQVAREAFPHDHRVTIVSLSPSGSRLMTLTNKAELRIWDVDSGSIVMLPQQDLSPIESARLISDDEWLVGGSGRVVKRELPAAKFEDIDLMEAATELFAGHRMTPAGWRAIEAPKLVEKAAVVQGRSKRAMNVRDDHIGEYYDRLLNRLHARRDWPAVLFHRKHFMRHRPNDAFMWRLQGHTFAAAGRYRDAAEMFDRWLEAFPMPNEPMGDSRPFDPDAEAIEPWVRYWQTSARLHAGPSEELDRSIAAFAAAHADSQTRNTVTNYAKMVGLVSEDESTLRRTLRVVTQDFEGAEDDAWMMYTEAILRLRLGELDAAGKLVDSAESKANYVMSPLIASAIRVAIAKAREQDVAETLKAFQTIRNQLGNLATGEWFNVIHADHLVDRVAPIES